MTHHIPDAAYEVFADTEPAAPTASRQRLLAILGWALAGFAATAAASYAIGALGSDLFHEPSLWWIGSAVVMSVLLLIAVVHLTSMLSEADQFAAHGLLWFTAVADGVLINVFAANMRPEAGQQVDQHLWLLLVSGLVPATGAALVLILGIAALIGTGGFGQTVARWLTVTAIIAGPVVWFEPQAWWVGVVGGALLACGTDFVLSLARHRPDIPAPALGACLVAGVTALVLFVLYVVFRMIFRIYVFIAQLLGLAMVSS